MFFRSNRTMCSHPEVFPFTMLKHITVVLKIMFESLNSEQVNAFYFIINCTHNKLCIQIKI